ncbi:hypothetical protein NG895_28225 [Aeoliella sp. ICT_H6.2]|uniref:Uncharacterized protein n=1 Tax=Aeoliella straminimaris TaxID=2954799 RepID=A0A9X2FEW4_9BACT|nr:hypothetical protein [Aeoliella straminimaris]MCO6047810.1 hypothetical protein [Aeoliella straminimaris]
MSYRTTNNSYLPPQLWLQPVSFDPNAHRQFAKALDESLARLVAQQRTRQARCTRPHPVVFGQADPANSSEDVLPDQDFF